VSRLILLRHGEVVSHRGDQPLTDAGREQATEAGTRLATRGLGSVRMLAGATRRAQETAEGVRAGLVATDPSAQVSRPEVSFALRNPDIYLGGNRVDMVSTPEAFADQVPGVTPEDVLRVPFYSGFLTAADRIEHWLRCPAPPGDDAGGVAARIAAFAASLGDGGHAAPDTVVGVTHSPVLRAVALRWTGTDPGEPSYLTGYAVDVAPDGVVSAAVFDPFACGVRRPRPP
jgi:broad specificity phosphatase PhoE